MWKPPKKAWYAILASLALAGLVALSWPWVKGLLICHLDSEIVPPAGPKEVVGGSACAPTATTR
jgi:hypothetical protein